LDAFGGVYKGKKVLITGHTGFKGSWLSIWLNELGAKVIGYALDPYTNQDNFAVSKIGEKIIDVRGDINNYENLRAVFQQHKPEIVFHLAAQPLVRYSYEYPVETFQTNVMGTINVLESIRHTPETKVGIMITTDKVYENKEQVWGYKENDPLGGFDPYSASKACAEIAIQSWRNSFMNPKSIGSHNKAIASVRAGDVIGGGDWAKDRIIPDIVRSADQNKPIQIRSPNAVRPWQFVLDALNGYLKLGQKLVETPELFSEAWNFGPDHTSIVNVYNLASEFIRYYGKGELQISEDKHHPHEANLLMLEINKAVFKLGWKPVLSLAESLKMTAEWYREYQNRSPYELCVSQIVEFMKKQNSERK